MKELPSASKSNRRQGMEPRREEGLKETKPKASPQVDRPSEWGEQRPLERAMLSAFINEAMAGKEVRPDANENSHWFVQKACRASLSDEGTESWDYLMRATGLLPTAQTLVSHIPSHYTSLWAKDEPGGWDTNLVLHPDQGLFCGFKRT